MPVAAKSKNATDRSGLTFTAAAISRFTSPGVGGTTSGAFVVGFFTEAHGLFVIQPRATALLNDAESVECSRLSTLWVVPLALSSLYSDSMSMGLTVDARRAENTGGIDLSPAR